MLSELRAGWKELHDAGCHPIVLVHGGARGADSLAHTLWLQAGLPVEVHHADWAAHGKRAGILRNLHMVELGAELCLAFPVGESRGTRHCMSAAEKAGIPVRAIEPRTH